MHLRSLRRDERRWAQADVDGDGALNRAEFTLFLHPEEDARMHSVVVEETLEDVDRERRPHQRTRVHRRHVRARG